MKIAAQFYTLREFTTTPEGLYDSLRKCHEIGYEGVQLSAVGCMNGANPAVDAAQAKRWLDEFGLTCCATHRPWKNLVEDIESEIYFHKILDCDYLALGSIGNEFGFKPEDYRRFLVEAEPIAKALNAVGIRFGYHNHAHEFARDAGTGRPCMNILTDPANGWLQMEVDTYWVADAGVSPSDFLRSCLGRIDEIHLKDREVIPGEGAVMAPVGLGNLNWDSILEVCSSGGTQWLIVEQDTCRTDPFACLQSSFQFLNKVVRDY